MYFFQEANIPYSGYFSWYSVHSSIVSCTNILFPGIEIIRFDPLQVWQHSFIVIDHEIFSKVILSIRLIQKGQLSVSGEKMCTRTG